MRQFDKQASTQAPSTRPMWRRAANVAQGRECGAGPLRPATEPLTGTVEQIADGIRLLRSSR